MDDLIDQLTLGYWDRNMYFDRQGNPMSLAQWAQTFDEDPARRNDLRRVAATHVRHFWVSTVWLGLNHQYWPGGPPLIFETMTFNHSKRDRNKYERYEFSDRYSTEQQARRGHDRVVQVLKARGVQGFSRL